MTRNVFEKEGGLPPVNNQQWLSLWTPYREDIIRILRPEYRTHLERKSETEFKFNGKKFRFLISEDKRIFARTKEKMWILSEFLEHYKDFEFEETDKDERDSYSYSQMMIQEESYYG